MNLKEAFRFQNRLEALTDEAMDILSDEENIIKVRYTYMKKKVYDEAEDEEKTDLPQTEYYDEITNVARFAKYLLKEKEKLALAIARTKKGLVIDIDSQVGLNVKRQQLARVLQKMNGIRSGERLLSNYGKAYRFNSDGNQVTYLVDVKKVTSINFDRNVIKKMIGELNSRSDEVSSQIDIAMVTAQVDYKVPFDVNETFSEIFSAFIA